MTSSPPLATCTTPRGWGITMTLPTRCQPPLNCIMQLSHACVYTAGSWTNVTSRLPKLWWRWHCVADWLEGRQCHQKQVEIICNVYLTSLLQHVWPPEFLSARMRRIVGFHSIPFSLIRQIRITLQCLAGTSGPGMSGACYIIHILMDQEVLFDLRPQSV